MVGGASAGAHQPDLIKEELQPCCFKASEGTGRTDRKTLVRHWIKKITVHPDRLTIEFKTGDIVETGGDNE